MKIKNLKPKELAENLKSEGIKTVSAINENRKPFLLVVIIALVLMFSICWITFFATVREAEQVMVPNVEGKELTTALLEMQVKELYPKIQLKYTDNPDDAGKILAQNPEGGSIVKAGRRITLTVSRGTILDHVENYIGQNYDNVKINLQTMFTGSSKPLIVLAEPSYKSDQSDAGTILAQDPPEGTIISSPVTVKLIVSRGPEFENTRVPKITGLDIAKLLQTMASSKIVFDFTSHIAGDNEKEGTVTSQQELSNQYVPNYTRVTAEIALPKKQKDDNVMGLFTANLPNYPYAVEMTLESSKDGIHNQIITIKHTGGLVTIPYIAQKDSELILSIAGRTVARQMTE
ncbi:MULTISPECIES: PASTA domain-containing protein [unclassified Treponema]|uniref:PASTA domain-containing protein n=1 Tax=unclassified Treponema TaxID=2638727 RepID=UPI0025DD6F8C|nr:MULTISPECIES: PASTA domain-containing protein [unclassified Treponema]MBQ8678301.1 PASTA domain-containing protein [Treponema sp.]